MKIGKEESRRGESTSEDRRTGEGRVEVKIGEQEWRVEVKIGEQESRRGESRSEDRRRGESRGKVKREKQSGGRRRILDFLRRINGMVK